MVGDKGRLRQLEVLADLGVSRGQGQGQPPPTTNMGIFRRLAEAGDKDSLCQLQILAYLGGQLRPGTRVASANYKY